MPRKSETAFVFLLMALATARSVMAIDTCGALPAATSPGFQAALQAFLDDHCYVKQNWKHDPNIRGTNGVHPNVKIWYSPDVWQWLTKEGRKEKVPLGGMLIKEQYSNPKTPTTLTDWAVMIRDDGGSWDGWWWGDLAPSSLQVTELPPPPVAGGPSCAQAQYPYAGFGQYCINCHASAADRQNTFATTRYVLGFAGPPLTSFPPDDDIHFHLSHLPLPGPPGSSDPACMVPESSDHVVAGPKPGGPETFLTSDQCTSCHNATATLTPARSDAPNMLYYLDHSSPNKNPKSVNLSPNGEWRFSMMGLAGRDPIFFSQLNSETTLHANLRTEPGKPFIENLCLHCHGVMGQRQYHADTGKLFTREQLQDLDSPYGALARDGISCTVCHRISADGLGTKETYTGNFRVGPADHMNGPFENPLKLPMKNALGMKPEHAEQITSSGLCGSCHTISLPVFRANGEPVMTEGEDGWQQKTFDEQTTFLEWQNSRFADNGPIPESCQHCHMPSTFLHDGVESRPLAYKMANIEDKTFPAVDHRAPDDKLTLQTRSDYRRHLLLGINVFALEMFKQFRTELGLYTPDPKHGIANPDPMMDTAIDQGTDLIAKTKTADVKILSVIRKRNAWQVDVQVVNKAGHSFPSGVGFRRAFLNFQMLGEEGRVVWASGNVASNGSNPLGGLKGVIVDESGNPLPTEIFTPSQQRFEPHYWAKNPIIRQDQAQIYEELVTNPEGYLTTSFIALDKKVKDNRLQPQGWSTNGPSAEETGPVGTCVKVEHRTVCDPDYANGSGSNVVRYLVPLTNRTASARTVRATLYYQTIPPYYQLQRATDATGTDTQRLVRFVTHLQTGGTPIDRWVLPISSDEAEAQ